MSEPNQRKQPDWGVILLAASVILALYAAAIHPIEQETERLRGVASDLAKAVLIQNDKIGRLEGATEKTTADLIVFDKRLEELHVTLRDLRANGTERSNERLGLLEFRTSALEKKRP